VAPVGEAHFGKAPVGEVLSRKAPGGESLGEEAPVGEALSGEALIREGLVWEAPATGEPPEQAEHRYSQDNDDGHEKVRAHTEYCG